MFPHRYFPAHYFAPRYWPPVPVVPPPSSGLDSSAEFERAQWLEYIRRLAEVEDEEAVIVLAMAVDQTYRTLEVN